MITRNATVTLMMTPSSLRFHPSLIVLKAVPTPTFFLPLRMPPRATSKCCSCNVWETKLIIPTGSLGLSVWPLRGQGSLRHKNQFRVSKHHYICKSEIYQFNNGTCVQLEKGNLTSNTIEERNFFIYQPMTSAIYCVVQNRDCYL